MDYTEGRAGVGPAFRRETRMNKTMLKLMAVAALATSLSGCFLTKIVTVPMRVVGAGVGVVGAVVSIVPGVGNTADAALEKVDTAIDTAADTVDTVVPI